MASTKYNACHFNYIKLLIYVANFRASLFLFLLNSDVIAAKIGFLYITDSIIVIYTITNITKDSKTEFTRVTFTL